MVQLFAATYLRVRGVTRLLFECEKSPSRLLVGILRDATA
jgi:hypothetical protein